MADNNWVYITVRFYFRGNTCLDLDHDMYEANPFRSMIFFEIPFQEEQDIKHSSLVLNYQ
jgi:hypothetical protein